MGGRRPRSSILEHGFRIVYVASRRAVCRGTTPTGLATLASLFLEGGGIVPEGLGDRIALGIEPGEQFDLPLRLSEEVEAVTEVFHPLLVLLQGDGKVELAILELMNDLFELAERLLERQFVASLGGVFGGRIVLTFRTGTQASDSFSTRLRMCP